MTLHPEPVVSGWEPAHTQILRGKSEIEEFHHPPAHSWTHYRKTRAAMMEVPVYIFAGGRMKRCPRWSRAMPTCPRRTGANLAQRRAMAALKNLDQFVDVMVNHGANPDDKIIES
jgi:hypothetical protein